MTDYKEFFKAALIRAVKTFFQTAVAVAGVSGTSVGLADINWLTVFSCSAVAAIMSLFTSIATNLPEVEGAQLGYSKPAVIESAETKEADNG